MKPNEEQIIDLDLEFYVHVLDKFGYNAKPALRIQRLISDSELMKDIAIKAMRGETFTVKITMKQDRWKAALKLSKLGIINNEDIESIFK